VCIHMDYHHDIVYGLPCQGLSEPPRIVVEPLKNSVEGPTTDYLERGELHSTKSPCADRTEVLVRPDTSAMDEPALFKSVSHIELLSRYQCPSAIRPNISRANFFLHHA
jgi:hypothetical protein